MICCDTCEEWFHFKCVGLSIDREDNEDLYACPLCLEPDEGPAWHTKKLKKLSKSRPQPASPVKKQKVLVKKLTAPRNNEDQIKNKEVNYMLFKQQMEKALDRPVVKFSDFHPNSRSVGHYQAPYPPYYYPPEHHRQLEGKDGLVQPHIQPQYLPPEIDKEGQGHSQIPQVHPQRSHYPPLPHPNHPAYQSQPSHSLHPHPSNPHHAPYGYGYGYYDQYYQTPNPYFDPQHQSQNQNINPAHYQPPFGPPIHPYSPMTQKFVGSNFYGQFDGEKEKEATMEKENEAGNNVVVVDGK